jgi:hypothetical protein
VTGSANSTEIPVTGDEVSVSDGTEVRRYKVASRKFVYTPNNILIKIFCEEMK